MPQKRQRVFIVSVRNDVLDDIEMPWMLVSSLFPEGANEEPTIEDAIGDLRLDNENSVAHAGVGISTSVLANRISHFYDLKGPSIQLDTACSSSLVALHQAVNSIKNNECEQAIVSGVNIMLHPFNSQVYYKAGMLNKEGLCRTFDKDAAGYVRGEGIISLLI